jgi:hypothetical protein
MLSSALQQRSLHVEMPKGEGQAARALHLEQRSGLLMMGPACWSSIGGGLRVFERPHFWNMILGEDIQWERDLPEDKSDPQTLVEALRLAQRRSFEAAAALVLRVLVAPSLQHVFNIASGVWLSVRDILATFAAVAPGLRYAIISAYEAEIDLDPGNRLARYNASDVSRMAELGWWPRPLVDQFASYLEGCSRRRCYEQISARSFTVMAGFDEDR